MITVAVDLPSSVVRLSPARISSEWPALLTTVRTQQVHLREFRIGQRDVLAQTQKVRFSFEQVRFRLVLRSGTD